MKRRYKLLFATYNDKLTIIQQCADCNMSRSSTTWIYTLKVLPPLGIEPKPSPPALGIMIIIKTVKSTFFGVL